MTIVEKVDVTGLNQNDIDALASKQIFREPVKNSKFQTWINKKMVDYLNNHSEIGKRYNKIHKILKYKIAKPGIKLVRWLLRKHIVDSDTKIPHEWYNNHIRIFYNCFNKANEDMWKIMIYEQNKRINMMRGEKYEMTPNEYLAEVKRIKHDSYYFRRHLIEIWTTEVLEDTADREWFNFAMMRMTHEMMSLYGVSETERAKVPKPGQYPVYLSGGAHNPPYFIINKNRPVWRNDEYDEERKEQKPNDASVNKGEKNI